MQFLVMKDLDLSHLDIQLLDSLNPFTFVDGCFPLQTSAHIWITLLYIRLVDSNLREIHFLTTTRSGDLRIRNSYRSRVLCIHLRESRSETVFKVSCKCPKYILLKWLFIKYLNRVTAWTRAALLAGKCVSYFISEFFILFHWGSYRTLNYISIGSLGVALGLSIVLPNVSWRNVINRKVEFQSLFLVKFSERKSTVKF